MIDTVKLHIPVFATYTVSQPHDKGTTYTIVGDVDDYGLVGSSRQIKKDINGVRYATEIYHAQESLPTSHSGIGHKFYHSANNCLPYLELNCSIAKIMQGHNVYGVDELILGSIQMLGAVKDAYPEFWQYLDIQNTKIVYIDITYSAQMQNLKQAEQVREYIRNVDFKGLRNQSVIGNKDHYNTIYFGSDNSKVGRFKLYCKGVETRNDRKELLKLARKNDLGAKRKLENIFTQELQDYADRLVRIEATVKTRLMQDLGIPQNLWLFYEYQQKNPNIYQELWRMKTKAMFNALQGEIMEYVDDSKIWQLLHERLTYVTNKGNVSEGRAKSAFNLYKRIQQDGYYKVKSEFNVRTFNRNVKYLVDCGISKAFLQNMHKQENNKIRVLEVLTVDFDNQVPANFVAPVPTDNYVDYFVPYLINALNPVANDDQVFKTA